MAMTSLQSTPSLLSTSELDKDSSRSDSRTLTLTILHRELMLIMVSLNNLWLLMASSISSWFLIQLLKERSNPLISMLQPTPQKSRKMPFSISRMPFATTTTTGLTLSRFQPLACWLIKLLSIVARLETFPPIWISINFRSSSEENAESEIDYRPRHYRE